jgi:hypothetical protein
MPSPDHGDHPCRSHDRDRQEGDDGEDSRQVGVRQELTWVARDVDLPAT